MAGVVVDSNHEPGGKLLKERKKQKNQIRTAGSIDTAEDSLMTQAPKSKNWILFKSREQEWSANCNEEQEGLLYFWKGTCNVLRSGPGPRQVTAAEVVSLGKRQISAQSKDVKNVIFADE